MLQNPWPDQHWFCGAEEINPPLAPSASHRCLDGQHIPIGALNPCRLLLGCGPKEETQLHSPHQAQGCEGCWVVLIEPISNTPIRNSGLWKGNTFPLETVRGKAANPILCCASLNVLPLDLGTAAGISQPCSGQTKQLFGGTLSPSARSSLCWFVLACHPSSHGPHLHQPRLRLPRVTPMPWAGPGKTPWILWKGIWSSSFSSRFPCCFHRVEITEPNANLTGIARKNLWDLISSWEEFAASVVALQ